MSVVDFRISVADRIFEDEYTSTANAESRCGADRPLAGFDARPVKGIHTIVGGWVPVEHRVTALAVWAGRVAVGCAEGGAVLLFGHVPPPGKRGSATGDGGRRATDAAVEPMAVLTHRARSVGRFRGRQATAVHALEVNRHGVLAVLHNRQSEEVESEPHDVAFWDLRTPRPRRIPARGLQATRLALVRESIDQFVMTDGREITRRALGRPLASATVYRGGVGEVSDLAVTRDGRRVAALAGDALHVWTGDGEPVMTVPLEGAGTVRGVAFNADGSWVVATAPGRGLAAYPVRADPPEPLVIPTADGRGGYTPAWWALKCHGMLWLQRPHGIQVRYLSEPARRQFSMMERLAADIPPAYDPADGRIAVVAADRHHVKIERLEFL